MAVAAYGDRSLCIRELFDSSGRLNLDGIVTVHDIASMQFQFEQAILDLLENRNIRSHNLACAGGCFLNVAANSRLATSGLYQSIFIPPYVGDMGTALGAALLGSIAVNKPIPDRKILCSPFLGKSLSGGAPEVSEVVRSFGDTVEFVDLPAGGDSSP